ncbi:MAG: HVO_0476 family zinc finger protein [Candidatus Methanomethylophilaceae archaeon]|nr:hypothetical protein [Candidatus Methanomethylophilaceae archaeon]MDD3378811.1 HVO_0476 family zinc finger protein [Candidatus Methanomethylophilaceae archaeon]MDY0224312.1 HVO_0476 family zinc finger protein [Candidatus Methanomethylophilaceae archaeon]
MVSKDMPEFIYYECPNCKDITEHAILKARIGKDNVTGTFRCTECNRTFSDTIRIPKTLVVPVLFSDGDLTDKTQTQLESDDIVVIGDEFYLDDGRRVCVTFLDVEGGKRVKRAQAIYIKKLWVKSYDVLSLKVSVNDVRRTYSLRIDSEPDDEYTCGMMLSFEDFNAVIHAIKTKERLLKNGTAEAREIVRIYGKIRRKEYDVLDFGDEDDNAEFNEADYDISDEDDDKDDYKAVAGKKASKSNKPVFDDEDQDFDFGDEEDTQ